MQFLIPQTIDLQRENPLQHYEQPLGYGDAGAHKWCVTVLDGGKEADLTGATATCYFTRAANAAERAAQGVSVVSVIMENKEVGNPVEIEFEKACYAGVGRAVAEMRLTKDGKTVTLARMAAELVRHTSDTISDPGNLLPSIEELLALQDAMIAATEAGEAATADANAAAERANAAADSVDAKVTAAQTAAENAEADAADTRAQLENVNSEIEALKLADAGKIDGAYLDENGMLCLTANGELVAGPFAVAGGNGTGGGVVNAATLTVTNDSGFLAKTIALGAACPIALTWSSTEDGLATGAGVLVVKVGGTTKVTRNVDQGPISVDVGSYLAAGANAVKAQITDVYGNSRVINFSITTVAVSLASPFDASVPYSGSISFPYIPTGSVSKTMHFELDGEEIGTATVAVSGRQQTYVIAAQDHGAHALRAWFTCEIDGTEVTSNDLYYEITCIEEGETDPIITSTFRTETADQFASLVIPWRVHDPANLTTSVTLIANDEVVQNLVGVDRTEQTWTYRAAEAGALVLEIACGDVRKMLGVYINAVDLDVSAETQDLRLYLSSYGRSNTEENPATWISGDVEAQFAGFNWTTDGWQKDEDGISVLRVGGDARLTIPLQLFKDDFRSTGKTIEIEFASRDVLNYDAIIASCMSGGRGFEITSQAANLKSASSTIGTQYKENEHIRLTFVVEKRDLTGDKQLLLIYLNGILSGAKAYPSGDDFSQDSPVDIAIGSNECTIDLYCIRVYDNNLTRYQILDNWIADTQDAEQMLDRYNRNRIYDDYGAITIESIGAGRPYLVLQCAALPQYKKDYKVTGGYYVDPVNPEKNFSFGDATLDVQGTSSQYYYVKNYKVEYGSGFVLHDGTASETYQLNAGAIPTNVYTYKADVASSEGANNVVLAQLYNELCPVKTPAQEEDSRVRQTIDGHPIVIFWDNGTEVSFLGKYNFNHDKGTPEVFGFKAGDESWEIRENGSDRVGFRVCDFSEGSGWENDFEPRYPEDNTDTSNFEIFASWLASTYTDGATGNALDAAVTYDGVEYAADTAEYRLAKYKAELADYADVDALVFYYVFTEIFLCIDQREKNAFPTLYAELGKWIVLFYDADSSLGTDNKGNLTFSPFLEDIDYTDAGDPVYNGQNSVLWKNLREAFSDEITAEYQRLRTTLRADGSGNPLISYEVVDAAFEAHQSKWCEAIFNEDGYHKSIEPYLLINDAQYLPMLQGKKELQRKWWMFNRFRYLDSKHCTGTSMTNQIMIRAHAKANIRLTSYVNMYGHVFYNDALAEHRMTRGVEYEFVWPASGAEDAVIGINDADMLTSLGDLSALMVETIDISLAEHLTTLKVGDEAEDYVNDNLTSITLGNNVLLKTIDLRNCVSLTNPVVATGCTGLEEAYFDGTSTTQVSLPHGGILKKLHLPATITNLTLVNQGALTEFVLPEEAYGNISTLRLENVSDVVPVTEILAAIPANSRVRIIGFDWTYETADEILSLYDYLDTMRGLDENDGNLDTAQMSGIIRVDSLTGAQLADMQSRYPYIKVIYNHIESYCYFYNHDGSELLYTATCYDGGDAVYGGSTPTRASTAQYSYTHVGWSKEPNMQAADSDALTGVSADRNVYAAFSATVRTYTVTWYNGDTLLETDTGVAYGTTPTYDGGEFAYTGDGDAADYELTGWSPAVGPITGDVSYYANWIYTGYIEDDWDVIAANVENNTYKSLYQIGSMKPLTLTYADGTTETVEMEIAGFDHDNITGGGKAGITFIAKQTLDNNCEFNNDSNVAIRDNPTFSWAESGLRAYCNETLIAAMPEKLIAVIQLVDKVSMSCDKTTEIVSSDKCWIPSLGEVYREDIYYAVNVENVKAYEMFSAIVTYPVYTSSGKYAQRSCLRSCGNDGYYVTFKSLYSTIPTEAQIKETQIMNNEYVLLGFCIGKSPVADSSWDNIFASIDDGTYATKYSVGQIMPLDLGTEGLVNMQIAAFDADDKADGSGKAPISWISKELLATSHRMNPELVTNDDGTYQEGTGSIGGWEKCEMRTYLQNTIKPLIPENVRNNIVSIKKTQTAYDTACTSFTQTTEEDVWIPSSEECINSGIYTGLYAGYTERIKNKVGSTSSHEWYLREVGTSKYLFKYIIKGGNAGNSDATYSYGIALGFCT